MEKNTEKKPVVIFDDSRGIYFGYLVELIERNPLPAVKLERARHCYYQQHVNDNSRGNYGLATEGPGNRSKIGPPVTMTVYGVKKIVDCSKAAEKRWLEATWAQ